jgi:chaperone required for assembly of F1-ATPase
MTRVGDGRVVAPRRFYERAAIEAGALRLDGKAAKTKAGKTLATRHAALMAAVAEEWDAQAGTIDFSAMPMTRYAMTLIDLADADAPKWRAVLSSFLASDLLCYRAASPEALVVRQREAWDSLLAWARRECGVALSSGEGVSFIDQPAAAIRAGDEHFGSASLATLLGMKEAAEISGSAVIALALARGAFNAEALFAASRVDETYQAEQWGADDEAQARAESLRRAFHDAARFLALTKE